MINCNTFRQLTCYSLSVKKSKAIVTKDSGLVTNWGELSVRSNKLLALATPARKTNSAAQRGVKRVPKPEPITEFSKQMGGFPEEFDQSEERGLIEIYSDEDEVATSRKTSQVRHLITLESLTEATISDSALNLACRQGYPSQHS